MSRTGEERKTDRSESVPTLEKFMGKDRNVNKKPHSRERPHTQVCVARPWKQSLQLQMGLEKGMDKALWKCLDSAGQAGQGSGYKSFAS